MKTAELRKILARQGYTQLRQSRFDGVEMYQSQEGRRVLLDTVDARILTKADIERSARACCGPDTLAYYLAAVHGWE